MTFHTSYCDGIVDCQDGSDEAHCDSKLQCMDMILHGLAMRDYTDGNEVSAYMHGACIML